MGPLNHDNLHRDFTEEYDKKAYPDFHRELGIFSKNPKDPSQRLTIDMLLAFKIFDSMNTVLIGDSIKIIQKPSAFEIYQ